MPVNASFFEPGRDYEFSYPRHNFHRIRSRLETRRLRVTNVRDVEKEPLDPVTVAMQPLLNRGRYLVTGQDLDKGAERTFYVEAIQSPKLIEG